MKVIVRDTYEAISKQTADELLEVMSMYEKPLLSPASGSSPLGLYKELVGRYQQKKFDHSERCISIPVFAQKPGERASMRTEIRRYFRKCSVNNIKV